MKVSAERALLRRLSAAGGGSGSHPPGSWNTTTSPRDTPAMRVVIFEAMIRSLTMSVSSIEALGT
ncbi:unannotated protein [freshwater metagenome]|uniref:Unannotated protein n=1 Tax=freshwater metagenome TaxID=449393 RepID=A0A6J6UM96_9ZZZZ